MTRKTPRRFFVVDLRSQVPFLARLVAIWAGGTVLLCALLYWLADEELGRNFYSVHQKIRNTWEILLPAVALSGAVSFLATIVATLFFVIHEGRRIGGPVHKFENLFRELGEGNLDPTFRFRKGDFLFDLGDRYRAAIEVNRDRIASIQESLRSAEEGLDALVSMIGARPPVHGEEEALEALSRTLAEARERAGAFRTAKP
jgi:hypothetical protein